MLHAWLWAAATFMLEAAAGSWTMFMMCTWNWGPADLCIRRVGTLPPPVVPLRFVTAARCMHAAVAQGA